MTVKDDSVDELVKGFWNDPEFLQRDKNCKGPGCEGTGFLRNAPGPNELPCPVCRPEAAADAIT